MFSLFIPIAAGYVCRFTPLGKAQLWRVAITHLADPLVLSFLWTLIASAFSRALAYIPQLHGLDRQFAPSLWIVFFTGCLLYVFSVAFHYVAMAQDAARAVEMEVMQTSVLARDAELRALRAQIGRALVASEERRDELRQGVRPAGVAQDHCVAGAKKTARQRLGHLARA